MAYPVRRQPVRSLIQTRKLYCWIISPRSVIRNALSLFADDGVFELPFLRSLGVEPRYAGRREITALVRKLLEIYPNFAFAPDDTRILIETPEKTFALCECPKTPLM